MRCIVRSFKLTSPSPSWEKFLFSAEGLWAWDSFLLSGPRDAAQWRRRPRLQPLGLLPPPERRHPAGLLHNAANRHFWAQNPAGPGILRGSPELHGHSSTAIRVVVFFLIVVDRRLELVFTCEAGKQQLNWARLPLRRRPRPAGGQLFKKGSEIFFFKFFLCVKLVAVFVFVNKHARPSQVGNTWSPPRIACHQLSFHIYEEFMKEKLLLSAARSSSEEPVLFCFCCFCVCFSSSAAEWARSVLQCYPLTVFPFLCDALDRFLRHRLKVRVTFTLLQCLPLTQVISQCLKPQFEICQLILNPVGLINL